MLSIKTVGIRINCTGLLAIFSSMSPVIEHSENKIVGYFENEVRRSAPVRRSTNVHPEGNPDNKDRIDTLSVAYVV